MFSTLRVTVYGDTYPEILENAESEISNFLGVDDEEELPSKINYELSVEKDEDIDAEFDYKAEVVAKIK